MRNPGSKSNGILTAKFFMLSKMLCDRLLPSACLGSKELVARGVEGRGVVESDVFDTVGIAVVVGAEVGVVVAVVVVVVAAAVVVVGEVVVVISAVALTAVVVAAVAQTALLGHVQPLVMLSKCVPGAQSIE